MSPPKVKPLLTGLLIAVFVAMGGVAMAQDAFRLWKPIGPDSFSGGRRSNDGVYSSLSGVFWAISAPTGGYVGATTTSGKEETRWVYSGNGFNKVYAQTNSVKINMLDATQTLGTRFEVGNRRGHHGWLVSGYGLPTQKYNMSAQGTSMVIRDEGNLTLQSLAILHYPSNGDWRGGLELSSELFVWDRGHNSLYDPTASPNSAHYPFADWQLVENSSLGGRQSITGIGYLWGYFAHDYTGDDGNLYAGPGVLAPVPIWFADVNINVRSTHRSAELMYTYRTHPFTWGGMEFLAGARYWDFDDRFGFLGIGPGSASDPPVTGAVGNNVDENGPISVLADMTINARGINRVFGPQVGLKLSRSNARWTFGAEGRLAAGINTQTLKTEGNIGTNYDFNGSNGDRTNAEGHGSDSSVPRWMPIGMQFSNTNFGHKKHTTVFAPMGEIRLSADWQWTEAVSFFGAIDGMTAGGIARAVRVTDYVVKSDGTIFGIRGSDRNATVAVYGGEFGFKIRR